MTSAAFITLTIALHKWETQLHADMAASPLMARMEQIVDSLEAIRIARAELINAQQKDGSK